MTTKSDFTQPDSIRFTTDSGWVVLQVTSRAEGSCAPLVGISICLINGEVESHESLRANLGFEVGTEEARRVGLLLLDAADKLEGK